MFYAYSRVSSNKQSLENQRFEIDNFCKKEGIIIGKYTEETISGTKQPEDRKLGALLKKMKKGDILICSELSRLGRNLLMIMSVLNECMKREIQIWTIKENYRLGSDINCKVLAFAFGLSAEIERELISQRTKEGLARRKEEGVILGRPKGAKNKELKLAKYEVKIRSLAEQNISKSETAKMLKVSRTTLRLFLRGNFMEMKKDLWERQIVYYCEKGVKYDFSIRNEKQKFFEASRNISKTKRSKCSL
jgi:DNA invertase Pin-like site-specific DNA recombinase